MQNLLQLIAHLGIFLVLVVASSAVLGWWDQTKDDDIAAALDGNCAVAIRHGAFYLALALALFASMGAEGAATTFFGVLRESALWGAGIVGGMFLALWINEKSILQVNNSHAIAADNRAVAVVEGASFLGSAIIMTGTLQGTGTVLRTIVYFLLGQLAMVGMVKLYDYYDKKNDLQRQIGETGNLAAGLLVSGKMIAIAIIIRNAISGDDAHSWASDLMATAISFVVGFVALLIVETIIDRVIVPHIRIGTLVENNKPAPIALVSSISIAVALFVTSVSPF